MVCTGHLPLTGSTGA